MNKQNIIDRIKKEYNKTMVVNNNRIKENTGSGGKIRGANGKFVEDMVKGICLDLFDIHGIKDYRLMHGNKDKIKVSSENGSIDVAVDVHMYVKNIKMFFECKTYLDKCYLDRAHSDSSHLKNNDNTSQCLVISLENSIAKKSENYFMDQKTNGVPTIDKIFYLLDGKRSSSKPIWKEDFYKPINEKKLLELIDYIESVIIT